MSALWVHGWMRVAVIVFGLTSLVVGIVLRRTRPDAFPVRHRRREAAGTGDPDPFEPRPWWVRHINDINGTAQLLLGLLALAAIGLVVWMAIALLTSLPGWS